MQGKNGSDIRNQQEKSYQNDKVFFLRFEIVLKMRASVINTFDSKTIFGKWEILPACPKSKRQIFEKYIKFKLMLCGIKVYLINRLVSKLWDELFSTPGKKMHL